MNMLEKKNFSMGLFFYRTSDTNNFFNPEVDERFFINPVLPLIKKMFYCSIQSLNILLLASYFLSLILREIAHKKNI